MTLRFSPVYLTFRLSLHDVTSLSRCMTSRLGAVYLALRLGAVYLTLRLGSIT